jgi:hypothetical protein
MAAASVGSGWLLLLLPPPLASTGRDFATSSSPPLSPSFLMALLIEQHDRYVADYAACAREPKRRRTPPGDLPDESTDVEPALGLAPS